jgi:sialate O-acetylesterase
MMISKLHLCFVAVIALAARAFAAELSFAPLFNDGLVLQCELPVNVWGRADAGAAVTLRIDDRIVARTVADTAGAWRAVLPPHAPGGAHVLAAQSGTSVARVSRVWFGEVWLATGQSNMVQPLKNSEGGEARLALTMPEVRFVKVPQRTGLPIERDFTSEDLAWREFAPPQNQQIAAVAFYFAEQIQRALGRRVGIVQSSYGGTPAQAWTPRWALEEQPSLRHYADAIREGVAAGKPKERWLHDAGALSRWKVAVAAWEKGGQSGPRPTNPGPPERGNPWHPQSPTVLFENMIAPLVPVTTRGVIWYQGEGNAGKPEEYRVLFPAMIAAWRKEWARADWPFLFVQLAAYGARSGDWPALRAAQAFTRDTVAHTGMAVALDCGEKEQIHPRAKQPVGERLARLALAQVYARPVAARGPSAEMVERADGRLVVHFAHVPGGLRTGDGRAEVPGFEVAANDGQFRPVGARIVREGKIELSGGGVPAAVSVRYAWANWMEPPVTLRNSADLPAEPFMLPVSGLVGKAEGGR